MGRKSIDRIGEKGINDFGSEMIIVNSYMKFNDKHMCSRCYDIDKRASDRYWQKVSEHYRNN